MITKQDVMPQTPPAAVDASRIKALQAALRGELIQPDDSSYDDARKVYNAMIDQRPLMIARCQDAADVMAAIRFAREHDLLLAVRGGGHNAAGLGVRDDALVIDLSGIKYVRVDPASRTVRVGGGNIWGEVDHATHAFGLATPSGYVSTTGVGGLTLGGGLGHLTRKYGLSIDNLLAADVVLADGRFVTADPGRNEDLFWAIRGGGGNFGVVTSFLFELHPVSTIYGGLMLWDLSRAAEVMQWYRDFITRALEEINGFFAFMAVPPGPHFPENLHGQRMCAIVWCYTGPMGHAEETFRPIRHALKPTLDLVGAMPFPALQSMFDALYPPGLQWYWKADFFNQLSDECVALHVKYGTEIPTGLSMIHIYPVNGAAHRIGKNETAWSYREANWAEVIGGVDPDPANNQRIIAWAKDCWTALHPHSAGGAYVNFMMEEGDDRIQATYRDNYDRLVAVKTKYDPTNLFRVNQNIRPTSS